MYKYFSPMEFQRGTNLERDPQYYEANNDWAATEDGRRNCKFYAWHTEDRRWYLTLTWEELQKLMVPEENEFGVVSP